MEFKRRPKFSKALQSSNTMLSSILAWEGDSIQLVLWRASKSFVLFLDSIGKVEIFSRVQNKLEAEQQMRCVVFGYQAFKELSTNISEAQKLVKPL